ncbi:Aminodeoxychorismate lyase [Candidatus Providencia siddallii]|uniref:Aminodeoxychorismate lyase n=1 Tax=Candidatus Providencia siddallii TaxID=1715285 RepID=A0A0M6W6R1_9GAMM|nr:Aminodeoxychorismate lyase [Candidatus Providencia siddallii]
MTHWINGQKNKVIDITDRSISFGDGCFTTIYALNHKALMLNEHIDRLTIDCQRLKIVQPDWDLLIRDIKHICILQSDAKFVLKIIISRGKGNRGYSSKLINKPTIIIITSKFPTHYNKLKKKGATLIVSSVLLSRNKLLAGIKHLNRLEQVLIKHEIDEYGVDEAIALDTLGNIIECCSANIFWRTGLKIYTPILSHSGVNGIMRQKIISILSNSYFSLQEVKKPIYALLKCNEIIICNVLMQVLYINCVKSKKLKFKKKYFSNELFKYLMLHI